MEKYDAVIIGIGQAGSPLAKTLNEQGKKTAIIERSQPGGSCVNYGCTPTKTMVASARVSHLSKTAHEVGIRNEHTQTNFREVIARRNKMVENSRSHVQQSLEEMENVKLIFGEARFSGKKEIEILLKEGEGSRKLQAAQVFINVGTSPHLPKLEGLDKVPFLTAKSIMELEELPEQLIILGGSYIGLEYGQMYSRLGSKVSLVETASQLAPREDEDVAKVLKEMLEKEGLDIYLDAEPVKVEQQENSGVILTLGNGQPKKLKGSQLLVATGTRPNTEVLQLDKAGIETDEQGYIQVNEQLQTNVEGVFALGDCKGGPEFTHISYDDYRVVKDFLFGEKKRSIQDRPLPYTMFTKPELGRIGLNEKEARKQGKQYKVAKMPAERIARAQESNQTAGLLKVLVDAESDRIIGATCLTEEGGEFAAVLQVAMMGGLRYQQLRDAVFSHPTWAESLNNLFSEIKEPERKGQ